ncbi:MAG: LPS assembly protein LptD [Acidobacteriota bacterium]|nr:LPS assembly protein LptD [Acidobacteriota bacterium]
MLSGANPAHLSAQQVTTVAPLSATAPATAQTLVDAPYPDAIPIPPPATNVHIETAPDGTETFRNGIAILDRGVVITFRDRVLSADHMEFNQTTSDVTLTGHVVVTLGESDERIEASHGAFNVRTQTGAFYDVSGSAGAKRRRAAMGEAVVMHRAVYANGNPFLFTGRMVVKTGPREYQIFGGTITSCQLPRPDWVLSGAEFSVDGEKASAHNTVFRLMNVPVLWLPYVTHPVDTSDRQTGILIPEVGINSAAKGDTIGEQVYWAINRSTDLTLGFLYYTARGWEQTAGLRYRGLGQNFVMAHYNALHDRGYFPGGGNVRVNQSGTDLLFSGRYDLVRSQDFLADTTSNPNPPVAARAVADVEYLSSFTYREAFSSNFNEAVSSDVVSTIYATRQWDGVSASVEGDRYQGEKRVSTLTQPEEQVRIFHAPALEFTAADHLLGATGLEWSLDSSLAALKRTQPNFQTSGMIARLDLHPELARPFGGGGWRLRPSIGGHDTFYSKSRFPAVPGIPNPVEDAAPLNRAAVEIQFDVRPPIVEKTFDSGIIRRLFGRDVKHTIEPEITYRYTHGIDNYARVLRFDTVDIASDTNELEYGATQRLFLRRKVDQPCRAAGSFADATEILGSPAEDAAIEDPGQAANHAATAAPICGDREWISWRVAQKYFFDPNFGGAVALTGPRSILGSTLDFSGISFLTGPRDLSPIVSRLRIRTSDSTDFEWDFDFDTCSSSVLPALISNPVRPCGSKFTANNFYLDVHRGNIVSGLSYARLNAPARSYVDGVLSSVADFNQMRVHLGFGDPARSGLSAAATAGLDLDLGTVQYGAVQTSYNWNCCGISVEYRKYELGNARNDNGYKFNFTLANIGSAGNLRHSNQVF